MNVNDILDIMDDMLDSALSIPLSGGKCMIDADRFRELVGDIRLNMPQEVKQAKMIVQDRKMLVEDAKREAENIIKVAEERARRLVEENEITRRVKERANEIMTSSQTQSRELKRAANEFADGILRTTEQGLIDSLNQVKNAKAALRTPTPAKRMDE